MGVSRGYLGGLRVKGFGADMGLRVEVFGVRLSALAAEGFRA